VTGKPAGEYSVEAMQMKKFIATTLALIAAIVAVPVLAIGGTAHLGSTLGPGYGYGPYGYAPYFGPYEDPDPYDYLFLYGPYYGPYFLPFF
jgi:hypothetical protein